MIRVNRAEFLQRLEMIEPGLSKGREVVEQSTCFVAKAGRVFTFNDEVACSVEMDLGGWEGAVQAKPLLDLLRKLPEDDLELHPSESEIQIRGKGKRSGIRSEAQVTLPLENVEQPAQWSQLDENFNDAVKVTSACCGKEGDLGFALQCVHIHPEYMEATDNFQMVRYPIATQVRGEVLVKEAGIASVANLGMTEFGETKSWLHFRNAAGLTVSVRKYKEDFPSLEKALDAAGGTSATLPGGLADAIARAEVFSGENAENNQVLVELRLNQLALKARSSTGWYEERKPIVYEGEPMSFVISPKILTEISRQHNECTLVPGRMVVNGGAFTFVSCLGVPD